ncbi:Chloride channel [Amanita muscaria]
MPLGPGTQSSDPLGPPSSTTWRRERLLRIGSSIIVPPAGDIDADTIANSPLQRFSTENSSLQEADGFPSYGTISRSIHGLTNRRSFASFKQSVPLLRSLSNATIQSNLSTKRDLTSRLNAQRPISAYDVALRTKDGGEQEADARINGIRVWYSSYSSIDWLHDAIKDSVRFSRLRKRKSLRAKIRLFFDKSLGWVIVTIVGFLTALVAFLVVRSEQWFFHFKDGYCKDSWWLARRFCCPGLDEILANGSYYPYTEENCEAWTTWADVISPTTKDVLAYNVVQYISYSVIAVILALTSCILTIRFTNSSSFVTRKESGVLSPIFDEDMDSSKGQAVVDEVVPTRRKTMYYAAGSGIPEIKTILSGFVIHGYLGGRTLVTKSVGLALSVGSGLSLGKEGPFVHIASCIGNIVSRFSSKYENNEAKRREILSAACAAGVAVAFGAPIGGTLFSLEEVSYFFPPKVMWRSFFCATIAAITLKMLDPFGTGKLVLFQVTYDRDWHSYELLPFLLLGVFGGVYGAYFSKLNYRWCRDVRNKTFLQSHPKLEVLVITLITTVLCFLNPYTRMGGTELVYILFSECRPGNTREGLCVVDPGSFAAIWPIVRAIGVAMIVKAALTIVTFGIKLPAGIFVPTLGVGACAGRILGIGMQWLQLQYPNAILFRSCGGDLNCIVPGLYAMVGAAAALSGVTRTTVSLAVIMFELTDTLTYAVPIMLSVLVAKTVADALEPKGIYDLVIELSQLPYLDSKHEYLWGNLQISDVTQRDVEVIRLDRENTVRSLCNQLLRLVASGQDDGGFPVLRKDSGTLDGLRLAGFIGTNELEHALSIVADNGDDQIHFDAARTHDLASSSISSLLESNSAQDPFDFAPYMDQAPLTIQSNSPMELLHQFFVKLGTKYVIVTDSEGYYEGVIDKKTWLAFLSDLEEKA